MKPRKRLDQVSETLLYSFRSQPPLLIVSGWVGLGWVLSGCLMTVLGAVRLHGRGVARLHDDWISLGDGG